MKKRTFLKKSSLILAGAAFAPLVSCKNKPTSTSGPSDMALSDDGAFELPDLDYAFDALEPNIDARTMEIHHDKHHGGYVRKLNAALENSSYKGQGLVAILSDIGGDHTGLRNNGGGHYNHTLYWSVMSPDGGGSPSGDLSDAINSSFGDFESFKSEFITAAKTRFGSGWAWLCKGEDRILFVSSTPNQDNPLMTNLVEQNGTPILGIDVWEHAYYLNYQNRRGDYISNFFNIINWNAVAERLG